MNGRPAGGVDLARSSQALGEAVRALREVRGWSVTELAERSQVSLGAVEAIERGEGTNPLLSTLDCISAALGIHVSAIVWGREQIEAAEDELAAADGAGEEGYLRIKALLQGGIPAMGGLPAAGGSGKAAKLWVQVKRVAVEGELPWMEPEDPFPVLRFAIYDWDRRPLHSFAIERELAEDALRFTHTTLGQRGTPAAAFADQRVSPGLIGRGDQRYLTMSRSTLGSSHGAGSSPLAAIRFELADDRHRPFLAFTIGRTLVAFMLALALPEHG